MIGNICTIIVVVAVFFLMNFSILYLRDIDLVDVSILIIALNVIIETVLLLYFLHQKGMI